MIYHKICSLILKNIEDFSAEHYFIHHSDSIESYSLLHLIYKFGSVQVFYCRMQILFDLDSSNRLY
jgi:hypothetical protein